MKLNENNFKHAGSFCHACKTSEYTLYDEVHGETYCVKCGLVLHQVNTRKSNVELTNEAEKETQRKKTC